MIRRKSAVEPVGLIDWLSPSFLGQILYFLHIKIIFIANVRSLLITCKFLQVFLKKMNSDNLVPTPKPKSYPRYVFDEAVKSFIQDGNRFTSICIEIGGKPYYSRLDSYRRGKTDIPEENIKEFLAAAPDFKNYLIDAEKLYERARIINFDDVLREIDKVIVQLRALKEDVKVLKNQQNN